MYGQPPHFGRGQPLRPVTGNYFQNPIFPYIQNPNIPIPNPTFPYQNPNFPNLSNQFLNQAANFQQQQFPQPNSDGNSNNSSSEVHGRIERAVVKARSEIISAGEHVSSWKVSQAALLTLQVESWEALGFRMQQVPSLHRLIVIEGKVNAFIHCFVAVRRITSLYDLELAICENEGVERFEQLELGPLLRHPLVEHYFSLSSDAKEAFKITSEEIIHCLCEFMNTWKKKEVKVDELLDFIAEKRSVTAREKLNVRIQSLGMHITHIRKSRVSEKDVLAKCLEGIKMKSAKRIKRRPLLSSEKKKLDDRFSAISQRIKSFSSAEENSCNKHIRFISSGSEDQDSYDDDSEDNQGRSKAHNINFPSQKKKSSDRVSSCPYPSAVEEMTRLGLKTEDGKSGAADGNLRYNIGLENEPCQKKRKFENNSHSAPKKMRKRDGNKNKWWLRNMEAGSLSLAEDTTRTFITTWKEACRENNVEEVLERMLLFYNTNKKKKIKALFSSYPFVGLLNVAVMSIKYRMWDSMYDTFQTFNQSLTNTISERSADYVSIEVEQAEKKVQISTGRTPKHERGIKAEDIITKIAAYFELDDAQLSSINSPCEKKFLYLRKLCMCEPWLAKEFAFKKFKSLRFGSFLNFLEKHMDLLPQAFWNFLIGESQKSLPLGVHMHELQVDVLLSQASNSMLGGEIINKKDVSDLLTRQFPLVCFNLAEGDSVIDFRDIIRKNEGKSNSKSVLFSASLFKMRCFRVSSSEGSKNFSIPAEVETASRSGFLGKVTSKDAIELFCKAPMLTDLELWSHWDTVFAPSLGPLVMWLLSEVNTKELLCLATKGGIVIRIDHSASIDSFLEVLLQGSPFETAVKMLSLFALYGGERYVPLSLLKCHAQQAFEVLFKNSLEVHGGWNYHCHGKPVCTRQESDEMATTNMTASGANHAVSAISRFTLDCLTFLPIEFCSFAADVFLAGLQLLVKDAPTAILSECRRSDQRMMLHEVGMSLGIVEWVNDYHSFVSSTSSDSFTCPRASSSKVLSGTRISSKSAQDILKTHPPSGGTFKVYPELDQRHENGKGGCSIVDVTGSGSAGSLTQHGYALGDNGAAKVVEDIRKEEFGLDPGLSSMEGTMLKKQHERLGRALHCLSHELYSQDSHFLLELVQNADDNFYPKNVEPTLAFILEKNGIVVLNNERGFSAENIRALCDVGNSTKRGHGVGYIGKKGIGFKSVFRVTDAPEIHSNGFHIKFDITEGQIGFVLPTLIAPCDIDLYTRLANDSTSPVNRDCWNTCIVLPFKSDLLEAFAMTNIISMFSDLHPSLLLFLHRLHCIKFRDMINDSTLVMKKKVVGNGIIKVSLGKEEMSWLVTSQKLRADVIRPGVQTTEISIAFTLQDRGNGDYIPHLNQQPVFAYLPLRTYGLKFIIQGDFVLPSSREEVDGDSPWNQWLLSEFPSLFVSAVRSFCDLPCYKDNPGKAVTAFMSFVPLAGEVHGFFSNLPRMILSKLRMSNCLLLEGNTSEWVPPCKVLRSWTEQARTLLPDTLLREHLGLGFLNKDVYLSDSLARALGVQEYGPKILLQIIASLCHSGNGLKSLGFCWLSAWLNALYVMLSSHHVLKTSSDIGKESDLITNLRKIPFIPLSDGTYRSVDEGTIWMHSNVFSNWAENEGGLDSFPSLYSRLRTVSTALFSTASDADLSHFDTSRENVVKMLLLVGVQQLSAHDIVKMHILPAIADPKMISGQNDLMIDYLSFVMFHLQSNCPTCSLEREQIIVDIRNKAFILTNYGYKRPVETALHLGQEFGNPVNIDKLISGIDVKWHLVDATYLTHPITKVISGGILKWRNFFHELGVTDFVHVTQVEKSIADISPLFIKNLTLSGDMISMGSSFKDWESQELVQLLQQLTARGDREKSKHLLEILDMLWDDYFVDKVSGYYHNNSTGENEFFRSSLVSSLQQFCWMASSMDDELHIPTDLFHDCQTVQLILGANASYAVPKVRCEKLLRNLGLKTEVTLDDILSVLKVWRVYKRPLKASISQMSKLYTLIWNGMRTSKERIAEELHSGPFIFVPGVYGSSQDDLTSGSLWSEKEVYWHDATGLLDQMKVDHHVVNGSDMGQYPSSIMLCNVYPNLHDFFVNECGVSESPPLRSYLQNLLQLSAITLPSQAAKTVFHVFLKWTDALRSGSLSSEDIDYLKEKLLEREHAVLPTVQDKWVSLHPSYGLICWCDDNKLRKEFKHLENMDFLHFGELTDHEKEIFHAKSSVLMKMLGIPAISEIVTREAIYYGPANCSYKASLINWALPYAQRYIFTLHTDKYLQLKQSGFGNLQCLRVVVVEKLFYRNVIERTGTASKKRFECSCLLQGNILYTTGDSDSHSLFMELSRVFYDGTPELHLANFLHMITTMAESGSSEEQTEFFILNCQKVPKLPSEESVWSLQTTSTENNLMTNCIQTFTEEPNPLKKKRSGNTSCWPPTGWKTAPGFGFALPSGSKMQSASNLHTRKMDDAADINTQIDQPIPVEISSEWNIKDKPIVDAASEVLQEAEAGQSLLDDSSHMMAFDANLESENLPATLDMPETSRSEREVQLSSATFNGPRAKLTGRLGELVAFRYYVGKCGNTPVNWVNEVRETGLPYDIVVGDDEDSREYIEVKATTSARKDWFLISPREWQFAVEKGESYCIAHVVLSDNHMAKVTVYRNPARLCKLDKLQLAVLMPKQQQFSVAS